MRPETKRENGVALIITLSLLVVATILVTGFLVSMRTERQAAQSMANGQLTDVIAQDAVQHAIALLDNNIPQPIPPGQTPRPQNWIVSPGLLTKITGADGTTPQYIPLSTNTDYQNPPPTTNSVDLNAAIPGSSPASNYMDTTVGPMLATWVNVLRNPLAPASKTNPIVGRYAFWMDDENAKINVNTAYGKPATLQTNPSQIYRTNPLDSSSTSSAYTDVGFNAIRAPNPSYNGTTDNNTLLDVYPGYETHSAPDYAPYYPNGSVANAIGTSKLAPVVSGVEFDSVGCELQARLYPLWHPSAINLDLLGASLNRNALADWIFNGVYNSSAGCVPNGNNQVGSSATARLAYAAMYGGKYRPLAYPEQIMQFVATDASGTPVDPYLFQNNKFNLTAYNRAPEFNAFGKPRLLMENRIRTQSTGGANDPMGTLGVSGAETEFCQTPDFDQNGPTYFHGDDQVTVTNPSPPFGDLGSVQMVADYIANLLNRNDWPGMPARSFVDKWGGDANAQREADQVAWNIVSLGTYASNLENSGANKPDWPDGQNLVFMKAVNQAIPDVNNDYSATMQYVTTQAGPSPTPTYLDPNRCLRYGTLSKKAIMPFNSKPRLNEVALQINATPVNATTKPGVFALSLSLQCELYGGKRCPPATFWSHFSLYYNPTHFFYTITDLAGDKSTGVAVGHSTTGNYGSGDGYAGTNGLNSDGSGNSASTSPLIKWLYGYLPAKTNANVPADGYLVLKSDAGEAVYAATAAHGTSMVAASTTPGGTPPSTAQGFQGLVTVSFQTRLALYAGSGDVYRTWEIVPVWDTVNSTLPALAPPSGQQDSITWNFTLDLDSLPQTAGGTFTRSLEVRDARLGGGTHDTNGAALWLPNPRAADPVTGPSVLAADSLGGENDVAMSAPVLDLDGYSWLDAQNAFYPNCPRPSIGFLSCVPTGMQRGRPNQTLTFGPSRTKADLPDWLLLDLLAPTLQDTLQPVPAPLSYLHSTMGKININALINPLYPNPAATRTLPMQALFKNMVSDGQLMTLAKNVVNHTLSGSGGVDWGAPGQYDYIGELCEVAGVADTGNTNWQKETIIRNLANLLTTQSNTFKVYGLAQVVNIQKKAGNTNYGAMETGDAVAVNGEKRFESVIERGVWAGVDGVPGNAHATGGVYDQISNSPVATPSALPWAGIAIPANTWTSMATWAQFDGPDDPRSLRTGLDKPNPGWYNLTYNYSTLKTAVNPARAHMTYRPISFRYVAN